MNINYLKKEFKMPIENMRAKDVAKYLGIGLSTVWLYVKQKKLHPTKLSSRVTIFSKKDIDDFVNNPKEEK